MPDRMIGPSIGPDYPARPGPDGKAGRAGSDLADPSGPLYPNPAVRAS